MPMPHFFVFQIPSFKVPFSNLGKGDLEKKKKIKIKKKSKKEETKGRK